MARTYLDSETALRLQVRAAIASGLLAGFAYLLAQMSFAATIHQGVGWEPLQRISAILLGPDAAPPPTRVSPGIVGMALLIHLPLSGVYGRFIGCMVRSFEDHWAAFVGVACGLAIYAVNFYLIAPNAFPWYEDSRHVTTALDHAIFGLFCAIIYQGLARRLLS